MSSILPRGILISTPGFSSNIERIDKEPLANEEIAKLWKVYTTTNRRLLDPTAERLENYWWRIWGSQKRSLRGATVARLFVEISNGTSFVPLLGPADHDESGTKPDNTMSPRPSSETASTSAIQSSRPESNGQQPSTASNSSTNLPPPILKKTSSASYTGPRPMTRFIAPRGSEDEDDPPLNTNCHVIVEPPTPDAQIPAEDAEVETQSTNGKKAHASLAANVSQKRRSEMPRKPSSSSPHSDANPPSTIASKGISVKHLPKRAESPSRPARAQNLFQNQENSSLSPEKRSVGRKVPKKARTVKIEPLKKSPEPTTFTGTRLGPALASSSKQSKSTGEQSPSISKLQSAGRMPATPYLNKEEPKELILKESNLAQAKSNLKMLKSQREDTAVASQGYDKSHKFQRSRSVGDKSTMIPSEHQFPKAIDPKSAVSVAPTYTATAAGKLNFRDDPDRATARSDNPSSSSRGKEKGKGKEPQGSLFVKRPVQSVTAVAAMSESLRPQTMPDSSAMSRSKSQLTLLLENDRARTSGISGESNAWLSSAKGGDR